MRLEKIKLAGFKSFVDPTVLELRSPLVAVVGPNGCGKSNVIDAVRWVMGESSAKNLRGESMSDVIFNGSSTRKPVGQASIELVFDNSDSSLGGEYANFAEISIRREATRDNQSSYYLNGVKCRRRDITDIFLGTGLGPRSYSIIEQGMISRVIEAKPDDLRAFFEEAAGVSLYRRRRQETETRMRHTRENLARLEDVRLELDKQLDRLKRQSEAALKYQEYKDEQEKLDAELAALRWHVFKEQIEVKSAEIRRLATLLEEKMAEKTKNELELEGVREQHAEKTEQYNEVHEHFYEIGTQIARNEQKLEHHRDKARELQTNLEDITENKEKILAQFTQDKDRSDHLDKEWETIEPMFLHASEELKTITKVHEEAVEAMQHFQEEFEKTQSEASITQQTAEVEKARIEQLDKQSREAQIRVNRLQQELGTLNWESLEQSLFDTEKEIHEKEQTSKAYSLELNELATKLNDSRIERDRLSLLLDEAKEKRQTLLGRLASLEALQQAALGKTDSKVKDWLMVQGCAENARLGETLEVEPGYEKAFETVLGTSLEAVCVEDISALAGHLDQFKEGNLTLFEKMLGGPSEKIDTNGEIPAQLLMNKVKSSLPLSGMLASIYVVEDLNDALKYRASLKSFESIVTRQGIWFGRSWLRVYRDTNGHAGVLERESEIKKLQENIEQLHQAQAELQSKQEILQDKTLSFEERRDKVTSEENALMKVLKELAGKSSGLKTRLEHIRVRLGRVQEEIAEQKNSLTQSEEEAAIARLSLHQALDAMAEFQGKKEALLNEGQTLKSLVKEAERNLHQAKENAHSLALKRENLKAEREATKRGIQRLEEQQASILENERKIQATLEGMEEPHTELKKILDQLLTERIQIEDKLNHARSLVEGLEQTLHRLEKQRSSFEQEGEGIRNQLAETRMEWQALEVRCQTVQEKLNSIEQDPEVLWKNLPEEAEENLWSERLDTITNKIQRLGAINLAAIEEFQSESERKNYLDAQHNDLTQALETLENAIRKIDRETRAKFKETFDKVDAEFRTLFPRLFGGGEAYLELIGEDLLEAGVSVMARPPGKKNSSIHLLSGGEKALTAVALVFAIFQLNPAPFCMLDEVDAPLDDANVGRFSELVKHMSQSVQFVYITHNKLAMEMAHHLIGVTMKEPGVSRLVAVDVDEAYAMATG